MTTQKEMAASIRDVLVDTVFEITDTPDYQSLSTDDQLSALLGGMVAGVLSVSFSLIDDDARDSLVDGLKTLIDHQSQKTGDGHQNGATLQ